MRLAFVSRISRKKNLDGAIRMLSGLGGDVVFDIYGPEEDPAYAKECKNRSAGMGIKARFHGPISYEHVQGAFGRAHAFLFPTHGENFGHVILEAMLAGCLPVVSDRTPWRGLARQGVGWDLPLEDPGAL